ncbi:hypothetical protein OG762_18790 [Streptomyces sp. NBC_01136]|uniref:hypothetical protein n=1 Tax=unclassified Streptomyces TaxID=2593676 RepID=UPI0032446408|nr:hypothetical protein OG762_18790 [Streptomyces sp. NBC_01136]
MRVSTRVWVRGLGVVGAGVALVVGGAPFAGAVVPEADLAYHGSVSMAAGLVDLRLTPRNNGPSTVEDATVRLRWSAPLADVQRLPDDCARSGERVVVCRTGALEADDIGDEIRLEVRLREAPSEVMLEIDTVWSGGAVDRNPGNDQERVLALDTGDSYVF